MIACWKWFLVAIFALATSAAADLDVSWTGTAFVTEKQKVGGLWQVTVRTVGSPSMTLRVEADGTEEKIRYIRVQAERELPLTFGTCVLIVRGINGGEVVRVEEISWVSSLAPADLWVSTLDIAKDSSGGEGILGTGSGGQVQAHLIGDVNVEGDVTADLTILSGATSGSSGGVNDVAVGGDLLGDVSSLKGIGSLEIEGDIGSSTNTVSITASDAVDFVVAANIWANITADDPIQVLRTPGTTGDFNGSLDVGGVSSGISPIGIQISRDINADLTFSGDVTKPIKAGRSLNGDISIGGDLLAQVFINWLSGGSWNGDVTVGNTTLSPKGAYTQTGLGGGAVGLAPFSLHKQDCDPPYSGATSPTTTSSTIQIELVHYGPIKHDGAGKPFKVEQYDGACNPPCNEADPDVTGSWTLVSIDDRTMTISGPLTADHHYHITPVRTGTDMLKCDGLAAAAGDVPVAAYTYVIYREP